MRLFQRLIISVLFLCSFAVSEQLRGLQDVNIPNVVIDGFNDVDECYSALENADEDGDRLIDAEEYVSVVQELAPPGSYDDVESFADLPFVLQTTFGILACLCRTDPNDDTCCVGSNATLDTAGAFEGETPTDRQKSYLFFVCSYTNGAINNLESSAPSFSPTLAPTTPAPAPVATTPDVTTTPATTEPEPQPENKILKGLDRNSITKGQTIRIEKLFFPMNESTFTDASYEVLNEVYSFLNTIYIFFHLIILRFSRLYKKYNRLYK